MADPADPPAEAPVTRVAGVVLAAGASARMGAPKSLLDVRGRPAVEVVTETLRDGGAEPVVIVLGAHGCRVRRDAGLETVRTVLHAGWKRGRTSSIQAGLREIPGDAAAVVLALVDMPLVRPRTVRALLAAYRAAADRPEAVLPRHGGRHGHPVLLDRALFARIAALGPDEPLRDLVRGARRLSVDVDDPGVLLDFDTPGSLADHDDVRLPHPD